MRIGKKKLLALGLGPAVAVSTVVASLLIAPLASGASVPPTVVSGNPSCSYFQDPALAELKVEPVATGDYTDGTLHVHLAVSGKSFDWSADRSVRGVIVKGGPQGANVYDYGNPGALSDTGLKAPGNGGLSHVSFCYNPNGAPPPSTTTTTTEPTKPTETTTTTTTTPAPPKTRCTGYAYDLRLDAGGILTGFVGPISSTDRDVFPDKDTFSDLNVVFPLTGATEPIVTATTLEAENSIADDGTCVTRVQYENLNVDLNNISPDQGIPVKLHADVLRTITTAKLLGDGTAATTSKVTLIGGSIDINGQGGAQDGDIPPNTGFTNEPACFANPNGPGKLCVTIMLHETSIIPNGIAANAVRIKVALETGLPPTSSQLVDLKLAHAEADAHPA
jgi:hypothetical protein